MTAERAALTWRQRWRLIAGGALVALVLAIGVAEVWIRLTQRYRTPATEAKRSLQFEATLLARSALPQREQRVIDPAYTVNAQGFRGAPFAVPKPAGVIRVVVLGGSSAFDIVAPEGQDWPHRLERALHQRGQSTVEVINAGMPGHATWDMLGRLSAEIWMFEPDYVVIYEAWNDIKYFRRLTPATSLLRVFTPPETIAADGLIWVWNPFITYHGPLDRFLSHSQVYARLREAYFRRRYGPIGLESRPGGDGPLSDHYEPWGPKQHELDLHLLVAAARAAGATPVLLTQARLLTATNDDAARKKIHYEYSGLTHDALVRAFAECDAAVYRVGTADGAPTFDVAAQLNGRPELFADHVHTTPAGSEALAEAVAGFMGPLLEARAGRGG